MKKVFIFSLLAVFALASCTKEIPAPENEQSTENSGKMKTITVVTNLDTKTTLDSNHERLQWSAGDAVSLFNNQDNTNTELTYSAGDMTVSVPAATTEIYCHYPYYSGNTSGPSNVSVYINNAQTQTNPGELNGYFYPMVAKGTISADDKAIVSFYPVASALALNIYHTGLSGTEKVSSVKVTPTANTKFIKQQVMDLTSDGLAYSSASASDPITVTLTNPLTLGNTKPADSQKFDGQIYVCLARQSYTAVKFEITTDKGFYTITSKTNAINCSDKDFVPVNINLNKADFEPRYVFTESTFNKYSGAITEGDYLIVYDNKAMTATVSNNRWGYTSVTPSGNDITTDNGEIVWHIAQDGSFWTLYNRTNKVYAVGTGVKNQGGLKASVSDTEAQFTVTGTTTYEFVNKKNSDAGVNCNLRGNGTNGFALYSTSTGGALTLYKLDSRVLSSIALSGSHPTTFYVGDTFNYDGLVVTATYEDASNEVVTPTSVSTPDLSISGIKTVTVTYTFNGVTKTATYDITVSPRPVFTVTLGDDSSTLTEESAGAGVVLPSRSNLGDYVFAGWSETNVSVETTTAPTIISAGTYNPSGNITLYPVYRKTSSTTGWVKTALSSVTAGTYIIYNQNGAPFNGNLSSGHGVCIDETITFSGDNATTIPSGALEITFTSVTGGFTLYAEGKGYLYAKAAKSGNLAWHETESSYWKFASSNWVYNSNSAYLRSFGTNATGIRTYANNSGDGVIQLIKKSTVSTTVYNSNPSV